MGTPGRVTDFMEKGQLKMDKIRFFVLDEADEMLNIGFKEHVDKIFAQVCVCVCVCERERERESEREREKQKEFMCERD